MSKKRHRPEEIIGKPREADVLISQGKKVVDVIKTLGITVVTCCRWLLENKNTTEKGLRQMPQPLDFAGGA